MAAPAAAVVVAAESTAVAVAATAEATTTVAVTAAMPAAAAMAAGMASLLHAVGLHGCWCWGFALFLQRLLVRACSCDCKQQERCSMNEQHSGRQHCSGTAMALGNHVSAAAFAQCASGHVQADESTLHVPHEPCQSLIGGVLGLM